jgi:integrase
MQPVAPRTTAPAPAYKRLEAAGGQVKTTFNDAYHRAGIKDFSPHDCRHTWHYAANRDLIGLVKLGGWKSEKMVYARDIKHLAESIKILPRLEQPAKNNNG